MSVDGSCFLPGCKSGYNGKETHLFKFPRKGNEQLRGVWKRVMQIRGDKTWNFRTSRLCDLHFEEKCIVKEDTVTSNGQVILRQKRNKWTLTYDAIPTIFSNSVIPTYFNKSVHKRKLPMDRQLIPTNKKRRLSTMDHALANIPFQEFTILDVIEGKQNIQLPNDNWAVRSSGDSTENFVLSVVEFKTLTGNESNFFPVESLVTVKSDLKITVTIMGKDFSERFSKSVNKIDDINAVIAAISKLSKCKGIVNCSKSVDEESNHLRQEVQFSDTCDVLSDLAQCKNCEKLKNYMAVIRFRRKHGKLLARRQQLQVPSEVKAQFKKLNVALNNKDNQLRRTQTKLASIRLGLKVLESKFKSASEDSLVNSIKEARHIPGNMKLAMTTAVKVAKAKSSRGRRYEADWLLQCVLLKIKSPKGYVFLRDNNVLPLPHPNTLHKLVSGIPCQFGFTDFIFKHLSSEFLNKSKRDTQVVLMFDEIKVREALEFDKFNMEFNGVINYGEYTEEYLDKRKPTSHMADHALVFMIRSLSSNWVQPIGAFASRGAAPGFILAKLLMSCILRLENCGANVAAVISDGATTNKNMWTAFGISGKAGAVINKMAHPCDAGRSLHFISDVPHIMKCIRNNFMKRKLVKFDGKEIDWNFYSHLYTEDKERQIRAAPKLSDAHLRPSLFQKMTVKLATQLFSKSVALGMQYYRSRGVKSLQGSEETQLFTLKLNNIFDILNATHSKIGLRKDDKQFQELLEFFNTINAKASPILVTKPVKYWSPNTFASDNTMASLRVSTQSTLDLITFLSTIGFYYVLTGKFNQDCLEKFFGLIRSMNGDDTHPTVPNFLYLYRLLCLYVPTSRTLKGNIRTSEDCPGVLVSYAETLKSLEKERKDTTKAKRSQLEDEVLNKICAYQNARSAISLDHDYHKHHIQEPSLLFQLCGYLAFKGNLFTDCSSCRETLLCNNSECSSAPESYFTTLKSLGGLKFPSLALFDLIDKYVEPVVQSHLSNGVVIGLVMQSLFMDLKPINGSHIGCSNQDHGPKLIAKIVLFYVTIRMFFFTKLFNREKISATVECKAKMKEAKLK